MNHACSLLVTALRTTAFVALCLVGTGDLARAIRSSVDEEGALAQIAKMSSKKRGALFERCVEAAEATGAPQVETVRQWAAVAGEDSRKLPERTEFDAHDSRKYKGGPPRRTISPGRNLWDDLEEVLVRNHAEPRGVLAREVLYEYSTGTLVQRESAKAKKARRKLEKRKHIPYSEPPPEEPFRELLRGVLPGQAAAEEALIQALDTRGRFRKEAHYFSHLYCDREANAYEGVTLFDTWSTTGEVEVPDPDTRAYAELIWDDDSVPVPLSDHEHGLWYPRMEDSYQNLRTHMFTTRAVAAVWIEGRPELTSGYANSIDIMNAAIALCDSDPEQVAAKLEASGAAFLSEVRAEIESHGNDVWNAGNARRDEHADGRTLIREAVLGILAEEELL